MDDMWIVGRVWAVGEVWCVGAAWVEGGTLNDTVWCRCIRKPTVFRKPNFRKVTFTITIWTNEDPRGKIKKKKVS